MFPTHSAGSWPAVALLCCSDALVLGCSSDAMVLGCSSDALALGCSSTSTVGAVLAVAAVGEEKKLLELMLPGTAMWVKEGRMPTCPWLRRHGVAPGKGSTAAQLSHRAVQGEHRHRILEIRPTLLHHKASAACSHPIPTEMCVLITALRRQTGIQRPGCAHHSRNKECVRQEPRQISLNHRLIRPLDSIWHL